jgi:DNA (cytosine-5)-methyltransferase 1
VKSLDLFAGIGGFALGFHRAGIQTAAFCEYEPYAQKVLAKNFPGVPIYGDIRELRGADVVRGVGPIDVVCGGFPCQDISVAGKGAGITGERSGMWFHMHRIIEEVRPRYVVAENSPALRSRGMDVVLRGLDALGFDAEWHCVPAAHVGAPHRRDRVWVVAWQRVADTDGQRWVGRPRGLAEEDGRLEPSDSRHPLSHPIRERLERQFEAWAAARAVDGPGDGRDSGWWSSEPDVGRVAHGVPARVDRLRCLGNAVVPTIPYLIGRAIMQHASADARSLHE